MGKVTTAICETTGRMFKYVYGGRRPRAYIDQDARRLASYLAQTDSLIQKLGREYGFTEKARKEIRTQLRQIVNSPALSLSVKQYPSPTAVIDRTKE